MRQQLPNFQKKIFTLCKMTTRKEKWNFPAKRKVFWLLKVTRPTVINQLHWYEAACLVPDAMNYKNMATQSTTKRELSKCQV